MESRIFVDTNVFLDLLLNRKNYGVFASEFFSECIDRKAQLITSVSCLQTVIYVMNKTGCTQDVVRNSIMKINDLVTLANTSESDIIKAVSSDLSDLADAILYFTAVSNNCDRFITRNTKDFPNSNDKMSVLKPEEF
ncbi:MAG: PIN domain-containing protein [Cyclobacteriaceae bacterium]